jgi:hypothetical protein
VLATCTQPDNKAKLTALVAECEASPPESRMMMRMFKIYPAVQEMMAVPLREYGFKPEGLMEAMYQIKAFELEDPSIAADTAKLVRAITGDMSDFA